MGEILSGDDFLELCLEDATIAADVYDEVRARLAEVEVERDAAARFGEATQDWLRRRLAEVEQALRDHDEVTEDLISDVLFDHWPMLGEADAEGHVVCTCGWQADVQPHNAHTVAVGHIMVEFVRARAVLDKGEPANG